MIGLEHIGICAKDTVKMKEWYVKLLKFREILFIDADRPTFFLAMPGDIMVEIYSAESETTAYTNRTQGLRHLAFVTDDIDKEYKNLKDNDVEIIEEISMMKQGDVRTVFFKDAEGNILHFVQRKKSLIQA